MWKGNTSTYAMCFSIILPTHITIKLSMILHSFISGVGHYNLCDFKCLSQQLNVEMSNCVFSFHCSCSELACEIFSSKSQSPCESTDGLPGFVVRMESVAKIAAMTKLPPKATLSRWHVESQLTTNNSMCSLCHHILCNRVRLL